MGKRILRLMGLLMIALLIPVTLTSCGNDDDEDDDPVNPGKPATEYSESNVKYLLDLSQDYFDLWNIEVTYTAENGETRTITIDRKWEQTYRYDSEKDVPQEFVFYVKALPKDPLPEVDPEKTYTLKQTHQFVAQGRRADGGTGVLGGSTSSVSSTVPVRGDKLGTRLTDGWTLLESTNKIKL